ncbi:MAG: APC family permease [Gemmatimonadales bacterium]
MALFYPPLGQSATRQGDPTPAPESNATTRELARVLRFPDVILIVVGTVIGSGIFLVPGSVLRETGGDVGLALLVWIAGGVLSLLGALTYAELGAMNPRAGGLYVYLRDAFGPVPAFLYGWALCFVIGSGSIATLAAAFARYVQQFVPLDALSAKLVSLAMIVVVTAVNVRGTRHGAVVQNWSTAIKVGALLLLSALLLLRGSALPGADVRVLATPVSGDILRGLAVSMVAVLWAYEGWHYVTFSAGEIVDAQRVFARGIVAGTAAIVAIYLLANLGYLAALGPAGVMQSNRVAADAVSTLFGGTWGRLVAIPILVSIFGAANGIALTAPRVFFAMARDGLMFRKLAEVHPRFGTPAVAILAGSAWTMVLAASGSFEQLLTYVVFTSWAFYALAAAAIFVYRRRLPHAVRPFRVPGYPVTPLLFIVAAGGIVASTLVSRPTQALLGLGIIFLGMPAYWWWRRSSGSTSS